MITTNAIQRTFHIKVGTSTGTCFTIDVGGKQYIVTAKHVVNDFIGESVMKIFHEKQWKDLEVKTVGHCEGEIDISVLAASVQISPTYPLEPNLAGLAYGQDVYFLGFPYGMGGEIDAFNRNFPLPFVKKAISSCSYFENGIQINFLDGHNNPGFSGCPVVFKEHNTTEYKVCSVISGYRYAKEPVYKDGDPVPLESRINTGIIISYGIKHAVEIIEANPIGFQL